MIYLAGLPFDLLPTEPVLPEESEWLHKTDLPPDPSHGAPFLLELRDVTAYADRRMTAFPADTPAEVAWNGKVVIVSHRGFYAELDPLRRTGWFCRRLLSRAPLEITMKVAMCCLLPLNGGVPLHAAAVVLNGKAFAFFGKSGAGKSTLASLAPTSEVLSDELIAVRQEDGLRVRATGFWGTLNREGAPLQGFPVAALFELHQETALRLERLNKQAFLRRLLSVVIVPPAPPLWTEVVAVLGTIAEQAPGFSLGWALESPPWEAVVRAAS